MTEYQIEVSLPIVSVLYEKLLLLKLQSDEESFKKWSHRLTTTERIYSLESQWILCSNTKKYMIIADDGTTIRTVSLHDFDSTYKLIDEVRAMRQIEDVNQYAEELDKFDLAAYEVILSSEIKEMKKNVQVTA